MNDMKRFASCVAMLIMTLILSKGLAATAEVDPATAAQDAIPAIEAAVFPAEFGRHNTLSCISGSISPATFQLCGDKAQLGEVVQLVIDLPRGFTVYSHTNTPLTQITEDNRTRITVDLTKQPSLKSIKADYGKPCELIWLETSLPASDNSTIRYHINHDGQVVSAKELKLQICRHLPTGRAPHYSAVLFGACITIPLRYSGQNSMIYTGRAGSTCL